MTRSSFRDLRVWKDAIALTTSVYKFTANFPRHELYGLSQQIRRAAVSVPSNIAEGKGRYSDIGISYGSSWLHVAHFWNWKPS